MQTNRLSSNLYLINFTLLIIHEIDSAYWQEWKLFGIPGGIQVFALLHIPLLVLGLLGYRDLLLGKRSGRIGALILAGAGIFAFGIHSFFILTGHPEFTLLFSLALLVSILLISLLQGLIALKSTREPKTRPLPNTF